MVEQHGRDGLGGQDATGLVQGVLGGTPGERDRGAGLRLATRARPNLLRK